MEWWQWGLVIVVAVVLLLGHSLAVVAGRADDRLEEMRRNEH